MSRVSDISAITEGCKIKWKGKPFTDLIYTIEKVNHKTGIVFISWISERGYDFVDKYNLKDAIESGPIYLVTIDVKDTRLARKLYPNAEVLDNGMLRIKEK
jgi:hypothetical protein